MRPFCESALALRLVFDVHAGGALAEALLCLPALRGHLMEPGLAWPSSVLEWRPPWLCLAFIAGDHCPFFSLWISGVRLFLGAPGMPCFKLLLQRVLCVST